MREGGTEKRSESVNKCLQILRMRAGAGVIRLDMKSFQNAVLNSDLELGEWGNLNTSLQL